MKTQTSPRPLALLLLGLFLFACNDDDDPATTQMERTYTLAAVDNSGVSGTVTFRSQDAGTLVILELTGTTAGNSHPTHIHGNNAADGGPILVDLTSVDGATGRSETVVTQRNDGTAITYAELIDFNGHVNVHKSVTELAILLAQGNIGSNAASSSNNGNNGGSGGGYN